MITPEQARGWIGRTVKAYRAGTLPLSKKKEIDERVAKEGKTFP